MTRRRWLASTLGLAAVALAARRTGADSQQANLNETLRYILRARRPQEFAFIDLVTQKVNEGKLPTALVLSMMKWAVEKSRAKGNGNIPFPYFQEGLRQRAKELGVELPPFSPAGN